MLDLVFKLKNEIGLKPENKRQKASKKSSFNLNKISFTMKNVQDYYMQKNDPKRIKYDNLNLDFWCQPLI